MCGISGLWNSSTLPRDELAALASTMSRQMKHRGPDDSGVFVDADSGIAVGHRRLSVVDLSSCGHQPMVSASGRYVITYNGEIFNHSQLRRELETFGFSFRGHSDTETMLAAVERWGVEGALPRFNGMFAFGIWDRTERTLVLARDRLGVKPLYYGRVGSMFVFASELKAIRALPAFSNEINRDAVALLLRHGYIPAPYSIYKGIRKLLPGTWLPIDAQTANSPADSATLQALARVYWSAQTVAERGTRDRVTMPDADAIDELERLLRDAIAIRMEADVPLGAFLSGGIDSSTIAALMQAQSARPVETFSIGFEEQGFNEAPFARAVARRLGTEHHEAYVTSQDALRVVPRLPEIFDEPFADSSQIPTFLMSRLARKTVTVSLSGDGGDELFGGYARYFEAERYRRVATGMPRWLLTPTVAMLRDAGGTTATLAERACRLLPYQFRPKNPVMAAARMGEMLGARTDTERYARLVEHWTNATDVVKNAKNVTTALTDPLRQAALATPFESMMYSDLVSYLPDDCLTKVDRASMAASLEVRVPLLDYRVVEFAWKLPLQHRIRDRQGKWLLRQVLYRHVPKALVERPKAGFGVPIAGWLRGPLRDWAESLLTERRLSEDGFFDPTALREVWSLHVSKRASEPYRLWNVLMFQAWLHESTNASPVRNHVQSPLIADRLGRNID